MLKIKIGSHQFKWQCPKHPKFNPIKDTESDIRGGCKSCHHLITKWREIVEFTQRLATEPLDGITFHHGDS